MRTLAETRFSLTPDESFMSKFLRISADVPWVCQDRAALEIILQIFLVRPPAFICSLPLTFALPQESLVLWSAVPSLLGGRSA